MKKLILILLLIIGIISPAFAVGGTYTTNDMFYLPAYGAYGTDEFDEYNAYMETADNAIKDNETASGDENIQDVAGGMFTGNTETGLTITYQDSDGTVDVVIGDDDIVQTMLKCVNDPNDEEIFTYEDTTGDFEWHTLAELSIQPLDGTLTALAGLTISTSSLIYGTGADAFSVLACNSTATQKFLRQVS
ncbi:MAG: hypothetical protein U9N03_03680, partial [Candidatus Caldatribacteriota bacterium]|nr:hypothetical protein [Candidatus Caldatribacteriota bacterium]